MKANDLMEDVRKRLDFEPTEKAKRKIEKEINFISQKEDHIRIAELCIKAKTDEVAKLKEAIFKMKAEMDKVFELPIEEYIKYDFNKISNIWNAEIIDATEEDEEGSEKLATLFNIFQEEAIMLLKERIKRRK